MRKNYGFAICLDCGEYFEVLTPTQKICPACKAANKGLAQRAFQEEVRKNRKTDWAEIERKCKEAGLSYGYAVARGII